MARNDRNGSPADNNDGLPVDAQADTNTGTATVVDGAATTTTTTGTVAEPKTDQRFIKYNVPQKDGTSIPQNRSDIIRGLWKGESDTPAVGNLNPEGKKWSRGDISRKLSELAGVKVIYQIVFAATKGIPGGPDKVATAAPATEGSETPSSEPTA